MAKALVIKDVNFYSNRLTTVNFASIPCTGISLDCSTKAISETGTYTLVATPTPRNTTDPVVWTSSDGGVATVNGGAVTAIKKGTATITATCGTYSASCIVTVTSAELYAYGKLAAPRIEGTTFYGYAEIGAAAGGRGVVIGYSVGDGYHAIASGYTEGDAHSEMYPYPIPDGTKKIKVSCTDFGSIFTFFDSKTPITIESSTYTRPAALVVDGETPSPNTQWSIGSWTFDTRTIDVPNKEGIDSFVVSLYGRTDAAYNNFKPEDVTIEFLTA